LSNHREAAFIGQNITNILKLFVPTKSKEGKFIEFAKDILREAEQSLEDIYDDGKMMNFVKILLKNKSFLSETEIQDEVTTMILAVGEILILKKIFDSILLLSFLREMHLQR
jgi:hypothetical protein